MTDSPYLFNGTHGNDIDHVCIKACKINGYFYMPWLVRPGLKHLQKPPLLKKDKQLFQQNIELSKKPIADKNRIEKQLVLFD